MADQEANLIIRLKDEASRALGTLKNSVVALGASVAGLSAFLVSSVKAFIESEKAINTLNASLKTQGIYSAALSKELQAYAKELQRTSTFSDEAVLKSQALLTTFGLSGQKLKETTKAALDLSAGLGIDLNTASLLLGKAFQGQTEALSRYGIKIDESIPASQRFSAILEAVNEKVGGRAAAELDTYAGKIQNLTERFDDVKEEIGKGLIPVVEYFMGRAEMLFDVFETSGGAFNAFKLAGLGALLAVVEAFEHFVSLVPGATTALEALGLNFDTITASIQEEINKTIELGVQDQVVNDQRLLNNQTFSDQYLANQERLRSKDREIAAQKLAAFKKAGNDEVAYNREVMKKMLEDEQKKNEADKLLQQQRIQNFQSTLSFISSLSTSHNRHLAVVGKAAAISLATIETYKAANVALGSAPPPFNFALAAAVVAAGLGNVAQIAGTKLASGGVVMPRMGGVQATIAEAGQAEAVIPLGSDSAREKMQEAGLGGSTNIHITVGTLVGSDQSVRELAKMIDKELFSLRRNNESVAFEAL